MAKPRLTNSGRDELLRRVLNFKFAEREKAQNNERAELFDRIIKGMHSDTSTVMALYEKQPGMFNTIQSFYVMARSRGNRHNLSVQFAGHAPLPHDSRKRNFDSYSKTELDDIDASFRPAVQKCVDEAYALYCEQEDLRAKLKAFFASVNTYKKLYEVWPELNEIVPEPEDETVNNYAMTVSVDELNAAIPLPSKEKK